MASDRDNNDILRTLVIRVEEMRDAVTGLEARLAERCPNHAVRIERLETILDGAAANGRNPGLLSRVGLLEDAMQRINRARSWAYGVAGTCLGAALAVLLEKVL